MTIFEWIMLGVTAFGLLMTFKSWRFDQGAFHGAGMARLAGVYLGLCVAGVGAVLFLIALAI